MNNTERLKRASTMGNHVGDVFPPKSSKSGLIHTHQSCFMDRYVILSSNLFRPIWDVVVFLLSVRVAFGGGDSFFLTPIELSNGKENRFFVDIARNYAKSWFLLDCIAIFPRLFKVLRLMRLIKLVRAYRLPKFFNKNAYSPKVHQGVVRIIKFVVSIMCLTHFSACLWYFVGELGYDITGSSWIEELSQEFDDLHVESKTTKYIASLYFAVSALAAVGFGDIKPHNTVEMGFSIVLMLCGATAFSYITATISSLVYDFDEKNAIYRQKMWNLVRFVGNGKISQELANQLMKEMLIIWQNQLVPAKSDTTKLKQDLTPSLLYQVSLEMHSPLIDHVHSFNSVI
eukprot:395555_1